MVMQICPQKRGNNNRDNNQQAAHGRRAGFLAVRLRALFANVLAEA